MPMYVWECPKCKVIAEILRPFDGYRDTPIDSEVPESSAEEVEKCEHTWIKLIAPVSPFQRGKSWQYRKGQV